MSSNTVVSVVDASHVVSGYTVKIFRSNPVAIIPMYATEGAHGMGLHSVEELTLPPYERALVGTGLCMEIPKGLAGLVCPRSGLAIKHGITMLNTPGNIDSDYRGEVKIILYNSSDVPFRIIPGMRIAQLVIVPVPRIFIEEVWTANGLIPTVRGQGGFGSTGM